MKKLQLFLLLAPAPLSPKIVEAQLPKINDKEIKSRRDLKIRLLVLLLITVGCSFAARAQVVETSKGKVEFIGLEQWTPEMVQEKLGYNSTDGLHFCAADLKQKLGFSEAMVNVTREGNKLYTIIAVIEPQYAKHVQYRPEPRTSIPTPDEWRDLLPIAEQKKFVNNMLRYGESLKGAVKIENPELPDSYLDKTWWSLLQQRQSKKDYRLALKILKDDSDYRNRMIAAAILTNFPRRDEAWLALMNGVRDQNLFVRDICTQALITLTTYVPRKVNWAKAAPSIHHILNGTNLFAFKPVLNTLTKTKVSAKLASTLLRDDGAKLLFAYLNAKHQAEEDIARQFLMQLSGKDFSYDDEKWKAWVNSLV